MKRSILVAVLVSFSAATAAAQSNATAQQGAALFTTLKCTMCHSVAGKGNAKGPLDSLTAKNKADYIREWLQDPEGMRVKTKASRTPAMKPSQLTPEQIEALVVYLMSVKPAKGSTDLEQ
jgi:mono/diheme cytochrome c family protein